MGISEISYSQIMDSTNPAQREKSAGDVDKGTLKSKYQ